MDTRHILVTGSGGQLGQSLVSILRANGLRVTAMKRGACDLEHDGNAFSNYVRRIAPTCIIHLAAKCGGLFRNMADNTSMLMANTRMALNVFDAAHKNGIQDMIVVLSTCVFPVSTNVFSESDVDSGIVHPSNYGYAHAKRLMATMCRAYRQDHNRNYIWVAPCNLFGPTDTTNHVIGDIIKKCRANKHVILPGTGQARRQFLLVDDAAELIYRIMVLNGVGVGIILAPSETYTISEVAQLIATKMGCTIEFNGDTTMDGQMHRRASNRLLRQILTDFKFTPLSEALDKTITGDFRNPEYLATL